MTIEVRIENKDAARSIEVIHCELDRVTRRHTEGPPVELKPGRSHTFHVYLLRDLLVREVHPEHR